MTLGLSDSGKMPETSNAGTEDVTTSPEGVYMVAKVLLTIAVLTATFEIAVAVFGRTGLLGHGDTGFIRFIWSGGAGALLAAVTGLVAVTFGLTHRLNALGAAFTTVIAALSIGIFLVALLK